MMSLAGQSLAGGDHRDMQWGDKTLQWRIQDLRKGVSKFVGKAHMAAVGSCCVSSPC